MTHPDMLDEDAPQKRGPGRPAKPKDIDFDSLSEDEKILFTYNEGKFDSSVCKAIQISKEEFDERLKNDDHFRRVVSFGRTLCQAKWEETYQRAMLGETFKSATMINFAMKNMFGWAEKTETTNNDIWNIEGLTRDEALQKLRELTPNILSLVEAQEKRKA